MIDVSETPMCRRCAWWLFGAVALTVVWVAALVGIGMRVAGAAPVDCGKAEAITDVNVTKTGTQLAADVEVFGGCGTVQVGLAVYPTDSRAFDPDFTQHLADSDATFAETGAHLTVTLPDSPGGWCQADVFVGPALDLVDGDHRYGDRLAWHHTYRCERPETTTTTSTAPTTTSTSVKPTTTTEEATTTTTAPPVPPGAHTPPPGQLAVTGRDTGYWLSLGLVLLVIGIVALLASRDYRRNHPKD